MRWKRVRVSALRRVMAVVLAIVTIAGTPIMAAIQTVPGGGIWLFKPISNGGGIAFGTIATLDGTGDRIAWVFPAPKTGNISEIGWRTRTVTTGDIVDVRLEGVNPGDANPSGSLCGTNTNLNVTVASSDDNVWFNSALTSSCAVTKGNLLAIVLSAATFVSSGNMQIAGYTVSSAGDVGLFPYSRVNATGSYGAQSSIVPILALKYDDGTYQPLEGGSMPVLPIGTTGTNAVNTANYQVGTVSLDEIALKFQVPFTGSLCGAWLEMDFPSAGGTYDVVLYDASSSALATYSGDTDNVLSNAAGNVRAVEIPLAATTIAANTTYRLSLKPTSANNVTMSDFDVNAAGMLNAVDGGANFIYSKRVDAGAWTDTSTKRPVAGLKFCGLGDGAGEGGATKRVIGSRLLVTDGDGMGSSPLLMLATAVVLVATLVRRRVVGPTPRKVIGS